MRWSRRRVEPGRVSSRRTWRAHARSEEFIVAQPEVDSIPDDWIVSHDELVARRRDPSITLVDALPLSSFESGHIPGAINLPLADVPERARAVLPDLDREIIAYCSAFT